MHVALWGNPGEVYVHEYGKNISMEDWAKLIIEIGKKEGYWKDKKIISVPQRKRLGKSDVEILKVGYEKLHKLTGWEPKMSWEEGIKRTIRY